MSEEAKRIRKLIIKYIEKQDQENDIFRDNPDYTLGYHHGVNTIIRLLREVFNGEQ